MKSIIALFWGICLLRQSPSAVPGAGAFLIWVFVVNITTSALVSITIGAGGSVKGEVVGETVTVFGTVDGRIHGQLVQLGAGGVVRGDIIHGALGIDPAATFEGASKRTSNPMADAPVIVAVKKSA